MKKRWLDRAYRFRRRVQALVGWRTRGVKVAAFHQSGEVLLVRHRYGDTAAFMLPGGGVKWREDPLDAAAREIREEIGCGITGVTIVGTYLAAGEGRRDTVHLYRAMLVGTPMPDRVEIAEAAFFALDRLLATASPATRRRLDEIAGRAPIDAAW
ncbi:NUDIX domain-containing protein [Sphingomonas sp. Tas61C01]|uniref:NUDIX domain-containing protein n=1 Tax=Sphingomonas sp. Tas61C01 TaxID=3458297 RepID=UPI00403E4EB4